MWKDQNAIIKARAVEYATIIHSGGFLIGMENASLLERHVLRVGNENENQNHLGMRQLVQNYLVQSRIQMGNMMDEKNKVQHDEVLQNANFLEMLALYVIDKKGRSKNHFQHMWFLRMKRLVRNWYGKNHIWVCT